MVKSRKIALVRVGDDVFALQDACPHKAGPLSEGTVSVSRSELICPWHRFRFDLRTGVSATNPELAVPSFPGELRDGDVFVGIGPPARATAG